MDSRLLVTIFLFVPGIVDSAMHFLEQPSGGTYTMGDVVMLRCSVAEKTGTCIWYWNSVMISFDYTMQSASNPRQSVISTVADQDFFLRINGAILEDAGDYYCSLTAGPLSSTTASVTIIEPPQSFLMSPSDAVTYEGQVTTLACSVNYKDGTQHWQRDGVSFNDDGAVLINADRYSVVGDVSAGEFHLVMSPTNLDDDGTYVCTVDAADNSQQITSNPARVSVVQVQKFEVHPNNTTVVQHESVQLSCDIAHRAGDVYWYKDGVRISTNYVIDGSKCDAARYSVVGDPADDQFTLEIVDAQIDDSATYRCKVAATVQHPAIQSVESELVVTDFNECDTDNPCGDGFMCMNTEGSYQCLCNRPQGCNTDEECLVDVGLYRCRCGNATNTTAIINGEVATLPANVTDGPYAIELKDDRSACDCYRCVMDVNVITGQDLLHCHVLAEITERQCPIMSNQTSWSAKFSEIAEVTIKERNPDVVMETFNLVFNEAILSILDNAQPMTIESEDLVSCPDDDCTYISRQVDDFAISLYRELRKNYQTDIDVAFEVFDERRGLLVEARSVNTDQQDISFPAYPFNSAASITVSGDFITSHSSLVVNSLYSRAELLVGSANVSLDQDSVNSAIISSTLWPTPSLTEYQIDQHSLSVRIEFAHYYPVLKSQNVPSCEFLLYDDVEQRSRMSWSSDGCEVLETNESHTTCLCSHLTSFAVLMRVRDFDMGEVHEKALEIISLIGCGVSLISLTLTIMTFCVIRHFTQERIIHVNLCLAIGVGQVIFLAGIAATRNKVGCTIVAVLLHYFFTSVFCWMLVEGIQLYAKLVTVFDSNPTGRFTAYFLTGWGVPLVIVVISVAIDHEHYGSENNCWLSVDSGLIWAFVGPALTVMLTNVVFLGMVVRVIAKLQNCAEDDKYTKIRASLKAAIVLLPLLGMTWLFGLLSVNQHTIFFEYIFAILNSLQGLFIFIFYCVNSSEVRAQIARKKQTIELTHGLSFSSVPATTGYSSNRVRPTTTSEEITHTNIASRSSIRISLDNGIPEEGVNNEEILM
ncbi:adhesion G protein-coupled receptor L4-like isoform X2 [Ptychodera flava]|uniref:adhesion G protein-coupled receptor L4-like isoform X2 n=1 Tax=Ptychodera flava TaxID=63121 RepID=UPI003969D386